MAKPQRRGPRKPGKGGKQKNFTPRKERVEVKEITYHGPMSVGELAEAGNNIRTHPQLTLERQAALRHGGISYVRHADPSGGYGCVIVE